MCIVTFKFGIPEAFGKIFREIPGQACTFKKLSGFNKTAPRQARKRYHREPIWNPQGQA